MMNWAWQQLANVAGTQEPIYGPDAIQPVTRQADDTPYTALEKEKLQWVVQESTCVETETWYFTADSGHLGMAQVIYSNVANVRTTAQFVSKLFYPDRSKPFLWCSDTLVDYGFSPDRYNFFAESCSVELSDDATSFHVKSAVNPKMLVDVRVKRSAPGFVAGRNGTSYFGTDPQAPWGSMQHAFWPCCDVEGKFYTKEGEVDMKGRAFFVHALQGMKPHHAAARWNFVDFQSPHFSAAMMEFTTPPSYGSTVVNVGALVRDGDIVCAGVTNSATHADVQTDEESGWPVPGSATYRWTGRTDDGKDVEAELSGSLDERLDRIDVMAEVPRFVKQIVAGTAGTKPYIYQFGPALTLKLRIGDETVEEEGRLFAEATFIS